MLDFILFKFLKEVFLEVIGFFLIIINFLLLLGYVFKIFKLVVIKFFIKKL